MTAGILKRSKKFLRLLRKTLPKGLPKALFATLASLEVKKNIIPQQRNISHSTLFLVLALPLT